MKQFTVYLENRPGALAEVLDVLAKDGANLLNLSGVGLGEKGAVYFITEDEKTADRALSNKGLNVTSSDVFVARMVDKAGSLLKVVRKLAENRINIKEIYVLGKDNGHVNIAIGTEDPQRLRKLFK